MERVLCPMEPVDPRMASRFKVFFEIPRFLAEPILSNPSKVPHPIKLFRKKGTGKPIRTAGE
jgi:hypothetical protein